MAAGVTRVVAQIGPVTLTSALSCPSNNAAGKRCFSRQSRIHAGAPSNLRPLHGSSAGLLQSPVVRTRLAGGLLQAPVTKTFRKHHDFRIKAAKPLAALNVPCSQQTLSAFDPPILLGKQRVATTRGQPKTTALLSVMRFPDSSFLKPCCRSKAIRPCCQQLRVPRFRVLAATEESEGGANESEIPATSDEFLRKVSSQSYTSMSKQMQEKEDASFEVLEKNPWGEEDKTVYVLIQKEESLFTMKVRKDRSDVEREFTTLFPSLGGRGGRWAQPRGPSRLRPPPPAGDGRELKPRFSMHVDTVCEGILVFEDEDEATRFCGLLETDGHEDLSIVETDSVELFALCQRSNAVAIVFKKGVMPPLPDRLQRALRARKYSLDD